MSTSNHDQNSELPDRPAKLTTVDADEFGLPRRPTGQPESALPGQSEPDQPEFHDAQAEHPKSLRDLDKNEHKTGTQHDLQDGRISAHDATDNHVDHPQIARPKTPTTPVSPTMHRALLESPIMRKVNRDSQPRIAEWSHQTLGDRKEDADQEEEEEVQWQAMQAIDEFDVYDDNGRLVARGAKQTLDEEDPYSNIGGASRGYTRVLLDEDALSATSMDDDTNYLFKQPNKAADPDDEDDPEDDPRDMLAQLDATKELLSEAQRIAYVGVVRLMIHKMLKALEDMERTRATKKETVKALESLEIWGQLMMVRLYAHMDIDTAEQIMIEQLAEHGVEPSDLVPTLMQNARVKNPMADEKLSPRPPSSARTSTSDVRAAFDETQDTDREKVPEVHGPEDMPMTQQIDLDLRWTVLCDLFLVLLADSSYDARSRRLLERVASVMDISWVQICRFEKRVIDQLEMQEQERENWDESEHLEKRRKQARTRKYVFMGLATVGGGLVIGLSAGLLAPVIGAGLAAGFTTIGVTGTAGFLGGVGGAALITSAATAAGGTIAVRASHRRTGHVRTFEYRPLHNNKRLNLILSVSGWMTGKVDDVRLPFSTVDPIMGDIYSLYWEPEMLQSMGDTINILATEALTQTIQQVLGSTILVALMAALQLPVVLTKLAYLIDNPWSVSLDRAWATGLILADSLMARHLGKRPITLVGFSLGARVVFSCLKELSHRGGYGLVQNVYLFGSPIIAKKEEYLRARSVVAGRFVNAYASNDWILGYLFRATSGGIMRVAGLAPVEGVPGLENVDVTELVNGHMAYRAAMPKLLRKMNWEVESDEFTEIEDPDPEDHAKRQRELIAEIDEARKKAEQKPKKRGFAFWRKDEKKTWETYDLKASGHKKKNSGDMAAQTEDNMWGDGKVMFDVDAIRKELAGEQIDVRELDSTMPPMQISTIKNGEQVTEYLRLPPGISAEEVKKMKLPPRPTEMDEDPPSAGSRSTTPLPSKRTSMLGRLAGSKQKVSLDSSRPFPETAQHTKENGVTNTTMVAREIPGTLPALTLSPSLQEDSSPGHRPRIQTYSTSPAVPTLSSHEATATAGPHNQTPISGRGVASPGEEIDIGHNAWADEHEGDEIKMTFA